MSIANLPPLQRQQRDEDPDSVLDAVQQPPESGSGSNLSREEIEGVISFAKPTIEETVRSLFATFSKHFQRLGIFTSEMIIEQLEREIAKRIVKDIALTVQQTDELRIPREKIRAETIATVRETYALCAHR